ncbi:MAG: SDR family oxidoreductase [Cyclobacteriaceae bacterium]|nr:SDR family oxidoreductase [Cyclobacteriaceae bacterium]MCH8515103.1 SDR family oxidoreductase [Cyclobacteriaceae bacterium]
MKLQGKTAIITGGAGGIGLATARLFLQEGAKVLISDYDEDNLNKAKIELSESSDNVLIHLGDVSSYADNKDMVDMAISKWGKIDILFLNAGTEGVVKSIIDYPEDKFDQVYAVNVKSLFLGMKAAFPHMFKAGAGSIIITSSVAGLQGTANVSAYVTSKHATIGLMRTAALEAAEHQVRVNSIHPSPVDNRMMRSLEEGFVPGGGEDVKKGFEAMIPLKRYGKNEDIAKLALFLASDDSTFITGATYAVDGGLTA